MKTHLMTATAALLALSAAAQAQDAPGTQFMANWDLDGDGQVTFVEAEERRGDIFAMFDENEDGMLNAEEYDAFDETRAENMDLMDEDHMGRTGAMVAMFDFIEAQRQNMGRGRFAAPTEDQAEAQDEAETPDAVENADQAPDCRQWTLFAQGWTCTMPMMMGPMGQPGYMGQQGPMGPMGQPGYMGRQGPMGPMGQPGYMGQQGPMGPMGQPGYMGQQGPMGPMGQPGYMGQQGPMGFGGMQGMGGHEPRGATSMDRLWTDRDRDGSVSHEEFMTGTQMWFARRDRNGDGVITMDDFPAFPALPE